MKRIGLLTVCLCLLLAACTPSPPASPAPATAAAPTGGERTGQIVETAGETTEDASAVPSTTGRTATVTNTTATATAVGTSTLPVPTATRGTPTTVADTAAPSATAVTAATTTAPATTAAADPLPTSPAPPADLLAVVPWDMGFLSVGTGGAVLLLDGDGNLTPLSAPATADLRGAASRDGIALILGDGGALLVYDGAAFTPVPGADRDLLCGVRFGDLWYIGGAGGSLYAFDGAALTPRPLPLLGDVTGMAANAHRLIGVTSRGEWFSLLPDGTRQIGTANADRSGEEQISFIGISEAEGLFWATGRTGNGEAAVFTTLYGGVWSPRPLTTMEGKSFDPAGLELGGITARGEQAVAALNRGRLLILPDCLACNKLLTLGSEDFLAVCRNGDKLAAVGRNLAAAVTDDDTTHQYKISFETARQYLAEGAVLIDVREEADYAARHIAGSVNIPLSRFGEELPERYPDRTAVLVLYCARGMRSVTAAQTAAALGYARAYSAGGIDDGDWEYEE